MRLALFLAAAALCGLCADAFHGSVAGFAPGLALRKRSSTSARRGGAGLRMAEGGEEKKAEPKGEGKEEEMEMVTNPKTGSQRYQPKIDKSGAGFNQFDPVLSVTSFVSRRFGLVGGLAVVGLLAATEGKEIVAALLAEGPKKGTGEIVKLENGLSYEDILIGPNTGDTPGEGKLVGMNLEVKIADQIFKKNVAFKFGQRPFTSVVCEGLEQGLVGMRVGGRRVITVPVKLGPPKIMLPPDVPLIYDVTLTEVFANYL